MVNFWAGAALALMVGTGIEAQAAAQTGGGTRAILGADAAACRAGSTAPAVLVHVRGLKDAVGGVRIQLYSDITADFLAKGKKLRRVDVPVTSTAPMAVCVALPSTGKFALVVLHDRDGDGKTDIWSDGYGFSNNPRIGMGQPSLAKVLFDAGPGVGSVDVVVNYWQGTSARPLAGR